MFQMIDSTLDVGIGILIILFSCSFHEAAHAWMAYRCGDDTAKQMGRVSLDPLVHICPWNSIVLPAIMFFTTGILFGGAKPVPIVPFRLRNPRKDLMLCSLAGPVSNLILAFITFVLLLLLKPLIAFLTSGPAVVDSVINRILFNIILTNLALALFNMLPIPPLDGSRVFRYLFPALEKHYDYLDSMGNFLVLFVVQCVPGVATFINLLMNLALVAMLVIYHILPF